MAPAPPHPFPSVRAIPPPIPRATHHPILARVYNACMGLYSSILDFAIKFEFTCMLLGRLVIHRSLEFVYTTRREKEREREREKADDEEIVRHCRVTIRLPFSSFCCSNASS